MGDGPEQAGPARSASLLPALTGERTVSTVRVMWVRLGSVFILALAGCPSAAATPQQLRARAGFDLNCAQDQLQIVTIDDTTRGVRGCGKQATYMEHCNMTDRTAFGAECAWVLNSQPDKAGQ
ncbi:MAG TPA: hypothetical protein VER04_20380 [Polyangiaceae bacterium]|jgi:hypothetical protein|nr:hypothetical protein [Polyangiaceae bacterium]